MSNLDDFFKKRDKKKKTASKSKFSTLDTDEFAKQLEATSVRNVDYDEGENVDNADTMPSLAGLTSGGQNENLDEAEWKPFDSDENKDYSGLRINIQNFKVDDEDVGYQGQYDESEKKTNCPWAMQSCRQGETAKSTTAPPSTTSTTTTAGPESTSDNAQDDSTQSKEEAQDKAAEASSTTSAPTESKYIPPALRRQQNPSGADSTSTATRSSAIPPSSVNFRRPNKSQPNILDTMEFPTLDAAVSDVTNSSTLTNGDK
jgi:hypothetical protein